MVYVVRVRGLSSPKGQKLNGLVGRVEAYNRLEESQRVPKPISIQRQDFVPLLPRQIDYGADKCLDLGSGVGRRDLIWRRLYPKKSYVLT